MNLPVERSQKKFSDGAIKGFLVILAAFVCTYVSIIVASSDVNGLLSIGTVSVFILGFRFPLVPLITLQIALFLLPDFFRFSELFLWGSRSLDPKNLVFFSLIFYSVLYFLQVPRSWTLWKLQPYFRALCLYCLIFVLGALPDFSIEPALKNIGLVLGLYLGTFLLIRSEFSARWMIKAFLLIGMCHLSYALLQFAVFDLEWLTKDVLFIQYKVYKEGILQTFYLSGKTGFFYRHNTFGKFMVMILITLLSFRPLFQFNWKQHYLQISVFSIGLLLSLSRHSFVGMVCLFSANILTSGIDSKKVWQVTIAGICLLPFLLGPLAHRLESFGSLLALGTVLQDPSMLARIESWQAVFDLVSKNPLGVGFRGLDGITADSGYVAVTAIAGGPGILVFLAYWIRVILISRLGVSCGSACHYHRFILLYALTFLVLNLASNSTVFTNFAPCIMVMAAADKLEVLPMMEKEGNETA
jgi:hypothetical protein